MNYTLATTLILLLAQCATSQPAQNPLIDYDEFQRVVLASNAERQGHRLTEEEFIASMGDSDTVILDARSESRFLQRHIAGAANLPFTDFTEAALAGVVATRDTRILIYCNNNFEGDQEAFKTKVASASLNLSTYTSLRSYGYTNVYELGPLLNVGTTSIPFAGSLVE